MPLDISTAAITEKNKITSNDVWLLLLKITYEGESPIYICLNNESITWPTTGGNVFNPAIFSLTGISENKDGDIPSVNLAIVDLNRNIIPYIEDYDGGIGAEVIIYVVHSAHLDLSTPELEEHMEILDVTITHDHKINFKLGSENLLKLRVPKHRYLKNHCRFVFKSAECKYVGVESECNRTLERCKELNNQTNYGGFPGVGTLGIMV